MATLLEKYQPQRIDQMPANRRQAEEIKRWMKSAKGALVVWGPVGSGKSLSVRLAAKELGYELVESNASGMRDKESLKALFASAGQASIFAKKKIILIEDIELIESKSTLANALRDSGAQIILITENPYETMPTLIKMCSSVKFGKIGRDALASFLTDVCKKEGLAADTQRISEISEIATRCEGDMRAALIDLESDSGAREGKSNIHDILRSIFRNDGKARISDIDQHTLLMWLAENAPSEFKTNDELADAYDKLSKADIFLSRIVRRQSWGLQKYSYSMLTGVSLSRRVKKLLPPSYRPPKFVKRNGATLGKISKSLHVSRRAVAEYIPIMRNLEDDDLQKLGMDDSDIEFIRSAK